MRFQRSQLFVYAEHIGAVSGPLVSIQRRARQLGNNGSPSSGGRKTVWYVTHFLAGLDVQTGRAVLTSTESRQQSGRYFITPSPLKWRETAVGTPKWGS